MNKLGSLGGLSWTRLIGTLSGDFGKRGRPKRELGLAVRAEGGFGGEEGGFGGEEGMAESWL